MLKNRSVPADVLLPHAYHAGKLEAMHDLDQGRLVVKTYGRPAPWRQIYKRILKEQYGIELVTVGSCVVRPAIADHAKGYNEVSLPAIEKRFGEDVFEKVGKQALLEYESTHNIQPQN
jgi:hypothetical protein